MGKPYFSLPYELCFEIMLHDDIKENTNGPFKKIRVARNRIVPVKTNFLKLDAAILISLKYKRNKTHAIKTHVSSIIISDRLSPIAYMF